MASVDSDQLAHFSVENIGGIDDASIELSPGVTVLAGRNATNRTSFLQAIQAALGSTNATLKGNEDQGGVTLSFGGNEYHRSLSRQNGDVVFTGDPYLTDPTIADLFAFLLESNEARRAVARGDDLREIIMRPVDVEEIRAEIDQLEGERDEIDDELDRITSLKRELPELEQRRASLREAIEETREELEAKEGEVERNSGSIEETREEKAHLEAKLDELRQTRGELEEVRYDIDSTEESITSLKQERSDLRAELDDLPEAQTEDQSNLESEIKQIREEKQKLEREVQNLQSVIQFNEQLLQEDGAPRLNTLVDDASKELTAQLVEGDRIVCWTCGSDVMAADIESTLASLKSVRAEKLRASGDLEDRLNDLQSRRKETEERQRIRDRLETRLEKLDGDIENRQERLTGFREKKQELTERVEKLEHEVDALESEDFSEILNLHKEANQLEFELDRQEGTLEDVIDEVETTEAQIKREEDLRAQREDLLDRLEDCRTRIDRIEAEAVGEFNTHMDAILEILAYENLERIWIERLEQTVREGRKNVQQSVFELHVVRSTENGAVYEDMVEHLSESEREVTGLIFALAGYLVHDVHETVPFMLLDSLESIDSDRIAKLVNYFAEFVEFLIVALLPEDAQSLSDEYDRITGI